MKRSLADARRTLEEDIARDMTELRLRDARAFMNDAEEAARQQAEQYIRGQEQEAQALRTQALHQLTDARDGMESLMEQASLDNITSTEYAARLRELSTLQRQAEASLAQATTHFERIEEIEA